MIALITERHRPIIGHQAINRDKMERLSGLPIAGESP